MRWERVDATVGTTEGPYGPGTISGHTCNSVGSLLYIFGGYDREGLSNRIHVFDTINRKWIDKIMKGQPPSPRDGHSCTTIGTELFVFGGADDSLLNDMHILDTLKSKWAQPNLRGKGPEERDGHSAAAVGKNIFIFGGHGISSGKDIFYNDLYILDTETFIWKCAKTSGIPPCARVCHTFSSWKNKIIVVGGDTGDHLLSDVHILDADSLEWKKLDTSGEMLTPRLAHTTVARGSDLFIFGGLSDNSFLSDLNMLNVDTGTVEKVIAENQGPSARCLAAGNCLNEEKGILVFMGGFANPVPIADIYYLHTDKLVVDGNSEQGQHSEQGQERMSLENIEKVYQKGMQISDFKPAEEMKLKFQVTVTEITPDGYKIAAVIDGEQFHGNLFSSGQKGQDYLNKKMRRTDTGGVPLNDKYQAILETDRLTSQQSPTETHTLNSTNSNPNVDAYKSNVASGNMPPSLMPRGDPKRDEVPVGLSAMAKEALPSSSSQVHHPSNG